MNIKGFWAALALGCALVTGQMAVAQDASAPAPEVSKPAKARPVAVAVVDVEAVFNKLEERERVQADLQVMGESAKAERDKYENQLKALQTDLEILQPNSPSYTSKVEALSQKTFEMQAWTNWKQNSIQRESKLRQLELYRKITVSAGEMAKENKYDLVIFKEPPVERMTQLNAQELNQAMSERKLIYFSPDLEITEQLIVRMNNEYKNRRAGSAAPAAKP